MDPDNKNPILYKHSTKSCIPNVQDDDHCEDPAYNLIHTSTDNLTNLYGVNNSSENINTNLFQPSDHFESFDEEEIFDIIRTIKDPEYSYSLEDLNVVSKDNIFIDEDTSTISVFFTPTVPHCTQASIIGLMIFVKLYQSLPPYFKIDVQISKGTHNTEEMINKQLLDKERISAALEYPPILKMINKGILFLQIYI
ncbi:uncharacterized protein TA09900 [Theileria annulata]|uniref:MIP18 family-like domain-containing protein n=1 Tax=Theileria annulata TaxID=5874 RepID=Q4U8P3_THEAN|nr:uncharacterized protein TA09900 [Theileria annulata]CAI76810.1 hypothetical protein, conserved [Theileria annulata]|eukprot:XP_953435.1 hypothetical protein, conserved [Theileria annulata]